MTEAAEQSTALVAAPEALPPAPAVAVSPLLDAIITLAKDPAMDADKLERMLAMQERMEQRQAERAFNEAFVRMKPKLPVIEKDGRLTYPKDKSKPDGEQRLVSTYATWEAIDEAISPILSDHGFALSFTTERDAAGTLVVVAILLHAAGHATRTPSPPLPCDSSGGKNNIQGWGSAMSYGKRYAATAALNLRTKGQDDDGKLAGTKFITAQEADELRNLISETGTDDAQFCQFFGVAEVSNLTADNLVAAKNMLMTKRARKKGAA